MQLITGPDVAHSVVQPHQLLDFVSGRLASHFVADARTLEARMAQRDRAPDRDGWYRVNSFFCRADTWQAVLARLVGEDDVILMDLRSFSARNAGCVHEIRHLVNFVPLGRCVFVVDASTDVGDLRAVLREAAPNTFSVCSDAVVVLVDDPLSFELLPHAVSANASRSASTAAPNVLWLVRIRIAPGDLVWQ